MGFIRKTINFENSEQMKEFLRLLRESQYYPHEINVMKYVCGWNVLDKNNTFVMVVAKAGFCNSKETYISELNRIASKAKGSIKEKRRRDRRDLIE